MSSILTFQPEDFTGQEAAPGNDPPLSLKEFCVQAWPYLEPTQKLIWSWHLDAICDHLDAVTRGDILRLVINMPPRCSKSMFASVMWPAWVHTKFPGARWMTGSYAMQIATRDVVKHRRLIKTDWYQRQWGKIVQLQPDQDTKTKFETLRGGFRMACSPESMATSEGGHYVMADDPLKAQDAFSKAKVDKTNDWWTNTMATREVVGYATRFLLIMQRLSERDTSQVCLEGGDYVHLCLPMEYDPKIFSRLPESVPNPLGWEDPRQTEGELLFPKVHTKTSIAPKKRHKHHYASQFQQLPSPLSGLIFNTDRIQRYGELPHVVNKVAHIGTKTFPRAYISLDCSFKKADESSYVAIGVWGMHNLDYYLLHVVREHLGFWDTLQKLLEIHLKFRITTDYVEEAANGHAIIESMKRGKINVEGITPCDSKKARAYAVQPVVEECRLWVPDADAAPWVEQYVNELGGFPYAKANDQVDMTTQFLAEMETKTEAVKAYRAFTMGML